MPDIDEQLPIFPVPAIGVGGIAFNEQGQVLLIKRNQAPACGLWSIPGGRLEPGENLADACRREFFEETNLMVSVETVIAVVERKLEGFHYVIIDFLVTLAETENCVPKPQSDVAEARWVSLGDFEDYALVDGLAEIILRAHAGQTKQKDTGLLKNERLTTDFILPAISSI